MTDFLRKLLIKLLVMLSIMAILPFAIFWLPAKPLPQTLFLGDSHFNKTLISVNNFALGSETTLFSFFKLKKIIQQQKVDTVYLAFGYHNLSDFFNEYDERPIIVERYFPYMPLAEKASFAFMLNYPRMITSFAREYKKRNNPIPGGFELPPTNAFDSNKCKERVKYVFQNHSFYSKNLAGLDSIKNLCRQNQIALFLVNTPLHPSFRKTIPDNFLEKYKLITQHYQLINLENVFLEDEYFLPDGDHLSQKGVKHFTELMNRIRANGGKFSAQ